jgi:outer membrane protein OmpA-like peptidoglycan-associated protein
MLKSSKFIFILYSFISFIYTPHIFSQRGLEDITSDAELQQYIYATAPGENAFVAVQRLAAPYIDRKDWKGAVTVFLKYREWFPEMFARFQNIIDLLNAPSQNLVTTNIKPVNTSADEYFPVISIDGKKMYFTGSGRKDCIKGEDIFYSDFVNNSWQPARNMGPPFSTREDDAMNSISADGNILVIFGNYKGAFGGGDNFYVEKTSSGWSAIKPFPKPVNSIYWDCDGFLTADGKAFLFSSDRPGGVGEFHRGGLFFHGYYEGNCDIYVTLKTDSGWSKPINLGSTINTPYTERSPFLHPDGKTLYFSSDGFYGLGGLDVFKSVRLSDTSWTDWSEPVNLGKDINTSGFDIAYKITTDGNLAYFSSNRPGGKGGYDIYSITLPEEAKPQKNVVTIRGKVTDENNIPLDAQLKWSDIVTNKNMGELRSNPDNGEYMIILPVGSKYSYYAEKTGYYSVSNSIDLTDEKNYNVMEVNIQLVSIKSLEEKSIKLNNIYFDFDKYDLKPESYTELNRVYNFLSDNPDVNIEISAYTDSRGSDEYNLELSQRRAQSVVDYLITKGISADRLLAKGYGKENPVADNETEEGRALNRRVEMKVLK